MIAVVVHLVVIAIMVRHVVAIVKMIEVEEMMVADANPIMMIDEDHIRLGLLRAQIKMTQNPPPVIFFDENW